MLSFLFIVLIVNMICNERRKEENRGEGEEGEGEGGKADGETDRKRLVMYSQTLYTSTLT